MKLYVYLALVLGLAGLIGGGIWGVEHHDAALLAKGDKQGYERAIAQMQERELAAEKRARDDEHRTTQAVEKEAQDAREELSAVRSALGDSERAGKRLRDQLAQAYARPSRQAGSAPAPAGGSTPADATADLLADVQRRLEEAEDATIRFADESHIAGNACVRIYEAVTPSQ